MSRNRQLVGLVSWFVACFAVAALGSVWTASSVGSWYAQLDKPSWNPPNWVFGPVWTALYAAMAVAAWLVWRKAGFARARTALLWFCAQLMLNLAWSGLFFGLEMPGPALVEIALLWLAIFATAVSFRRHSALAAGLLVPYLVWVGYAASLNAALWWLNR